LNIVDAGANENLSRPAHVEHRLVLVKTKTHQDQQMVNIAGAGENENSPRPTLAQHP
jgi:hypothetical protein